MHFVKQKWFGLKNTRKIRSLWDDCTPFCQYAEGNEFIESGHKLDNFLDAFLTAKEELCKDKEKSIKYLLDSNFGDCTDILVTLIQISEREAEKNSIHNVENTYMLTPELMNKIFLVIDTILQGDKYQLVFKSSPIHIEKILNLLHTLSNEQNKVALLQIVRTIGGNQDLRSEIVKLESFRKILNLLQTNDDKLCKEILITLKFFLKDDTVQSFDTQQNSSYWVPFHFDNLIWKRKIFSKFLGQLRFFSKDSNKSTEKEYTKENGLYPLSSKEITDEIEKLTESIELKKLNKQNFPRHLKEIDEITKNFISSPEMFSSLLNSLKYSDISTQLEFFEIICNLLFNNLEIQKEFKKIDGYNFFVDLIDNISDSSPEAKRFIKKIFHIISVVVEDGNKNRRVGNHDALQFLFQLLNITSKLQPKLQALHTIQELLFQNPLNVVDIMYVKGIDTLFQILRNTRELMYPPNHDEDNLQLVFAVNDLIDYIAIISISHNYDIIHTYVKILFQEEDLEISNTIKFIVLHSLVKLASNILFYKKDLPVLLSSNLITLLMKYIKELKSTSHNSKQLENLFEMDDDSDGSISSLSAPDLSNSDSNQQDNLMPEPWIDQILLILELIGLHILGLPNFHESFNIELLVNLVSNKLPLEVAELSLWLMQQIIIKTCSSNDRDTPQLLYLIDLIDNPYLSDLAKERVCYSVAELLCSSNNVELKKRFQKSGGILKLLELLEENENRSLSYAVFFALGEAIRACESNKSFVAQQIGFPELLRIIKSASLELDLILFQSLFEIITTHSNSKFGNIEYDITLYLSSEDKEAMILFKKKYGNPIVHSSRVSSIIMNIANPQFFDRKTYPRLRTLKSGTSPNDTLTNSATSSDSSSFANITDTDFSSSDEYNISLNGSIGTASTSGANSHHSSTNTVVRFQLSKSNSRDNLFDENDGDAGDDENELISIANAISKEFSHLTFTNNDSVILLMDLLPKSSVSTQLSVLIILSNFLQSNPNNEKIFSYVKTINDVINLATQSNNLRIRTAYFQLASIIGKYNMNVSSAVSLFDLAVDKKFETFQLDILQLIYNIVTRKSPDSYFYLDGYSGMFQISLLDRFPSAKNGYTFSCWIKIQNFLYDEIGLFSWQNQHQNTIFELYFKKFIVDQSIKYYLSVQTQNHPMPLEDLSFDSFSFYEMNDSWHLITITHVQQDITLYIDGELIQRCSSFNYPRTVSKDRALTGRIGCRLYGKAPNQKKGYFSGKLGSIHFVQSVLEDDIIQRIFISGSLQDIPLTKVGAKNKEFLIIDPICFENYHLSSELLEQSNYHLASNNNNNNSENNNNNVAIDDYPICISPSNSPPDYQLLEKRQGYKVGNPVGGMYFFHTLSLISVALEIRAMERCFYFISQSGEIQLLGLKILTLLIQKNNDNMKEFKEKLNGFSVLYYLLIISQQRNTTIQSLENSNSFEIFEILFDMLSDGQIIHPQKRFIFTHKECFQLILDYIIFCNHQYQHIRSSNNNQALRYFQGNYNNYFKEVVQKKIHRTFYDNIVFYRSNIDFIINYIGIFPIIEYLQHLTTSTIQEAFPLIQLIAVIITTKFSTFDAEILLNYVYSTNIKLPIKNIQTLSLARLNKKPAIHNNHHSSNNNILSDEADHHHNNTDSDSSNDSDDSSSNEGDHIEKESTQSESQIQIKIQLLHLLCSVLSSSPHLIEHFKDFVDCFVLLQNSNEGIRLFAIKMIGIITSGLSSVNNTKYSKIYSSPFVISTLSSFPLTLLTYNQLIDLLIGECKFIADQSHLQNENNKTVKQRGTNNSLSAINVNINTENNFLKSSTNAINSNLLFTSFTNITSNSIITYPEIIELILEMISLQHQQQQQQHHHNDDNLYANINNLKLKFFSQLEQLLSTETNMNQLWEYPWLEWFEKFLNPKTDPFSDIQHNNNDDDDDDNDTTIDYGAQVTSQGLSSIIKIIQKMMNYEISRESMRFMKLKEMNEHPSFQLFVLEMIVNSFDMNPCLDDKDGFLIINNLTILYRDVENIRHSGRVCMKILNDINLLAYQNTAEVRTKMKESGIFDIRDQLILHFLRGTFNPSITAQFISSFSFHSIANQPKFRENHGIVYLIRFLTNNYFFSLKKETGEIPQPITQIFHILKNVLSTSGENTSIICRILSDEDVCERFFLMQKDDSRIFLTWFLSENTKRQEIAERIDNTIAPLETMIKQHIAKVDVFQEWKRKERIDKIAQERETTLRLIENLNEKVHNHSKISKLSHQKRIDMSYDERISRYLFGLHHFKENPFVQPINL